ncbi:MAG: hypothetical protein RLZZ84_209 [Pseudomonadota bacterium]
MSVPMPDHDPAPNKPDPMALQLRLLSVLVVILGLGLLMALPFVLSIGAVVFLPFAAALVLSIMLFPLADWLARWKIPNLIASFLALAIAGAVFVLLLGAVLQPALDTVDRLPEMARKVSQQATQLRGSLGWINDLNRQLLRITGHGSSREVVLAGPTVIEQVAFATPTLVLEALFTLLLALFMIASRIRMRDHLRHDRSASAAMIKAARLVREVQDLVASYMLTVGLINLGIGVIVTCGTWLLGFQTPLVWGGFAALLNFLPYLGPLAMTGALALFGLGNSDTVLAGLIPPAAYLCLHAIEANLVTPAVLGRRFTVNPVMILLAISYFYWIWGVLGALLAMPILLTVTAVFHHVGKPNLIGFVFGEPLFAPPTSLHNATRSDA